MLKQSLPTPYYERDGITIYHADCRDVLPHLPKPDLVLTDPPYALGFPYIGYDDTVENLQSTLRVVMPYAINEVGRAVVMCGITQTHLYPNPDWICAVTWNTTGSFGKYGYTQWMPVLCYGPDIEGFGNVNGITKTDLYRINGGGSVGFQRSKTEEEHTCPKPLNVVAWTVQRFSRQSDVILDPSWAAAPRFARQWTSDAKPSESRLKSGTARLPSSVSSNQ